MTQCEAWNYLANKWRNPVYHPSLDLEQTPCIEIENEYIFGLCRAVFNLHYYNLIDNHTHNQMRKTLKSFLPIKKYDSTQYFGGYLYPLCLEGCTLRAALCTTFALQTKED